MKDKTNMTRILAAAINANNITVVLLGSNGLPHPYNITAGHPNFETIQQKVKRNDATGLEELINISRAVERWGNGTIIVVDGEVHFNGKVIHNSLTRRIMDMLEDGEDAASLVNFLVNLESNPSMTARNELYDFLSGNNLPITPDGHFLAYKRIRGDYKDIYTASMDNRPGKLVKMNRAEVDDNRNRTCSAGLHFASLEYARDHYGCRNNGERMVVLKINPADVVSIPTDYNNQKGRAWQYQVIGEIDLDKLYEKDYLESYSVVHDEDYDFEEGETIDSFLSRKASQQPRDSRGRFLKAKSR